MRKQFYGFDGVAAAAVVGFQIKDTEIRLSQTKGLSKSISEIDHKKGKVGRICDGHFLEGGRQILYYRDAPGRCLFVSCPGWYFLSDIVYDSSEKTYVVPNGTLIETKRVYYD